MPAVTPYTRLKNFTQYALDHTGAPYNASDHDAELNAIATTLAGLLLNLNTIQRADGKLANSSVHPDALSTATMALISGWTPKGLWLTATAYAVKDVVQQGTVSYVCAVAHVSGVFATDQAAGKWITLGKTTGDTAAGVTFTPYGHIAATDVQTALQEMNDETALVGGSAAQAFLAADATGKNNAATVGQIQRGELMHALAAGTSDALTATVTSGETVLKDGMRACVEATAANGTTAPTLNLTLGASATAAKTIKKGAGSALVAGDIAGAEHKLDLIYSVTLDCWLLLNPAFSVGVSTATIAPSDVRNVGLAFSVGASALTANLTTATGGTPTASDQVQVAMRDATAATGKYATRTAQAALSLSVPSGATLGHASGVDSPMHWYLIDNAGALELAVSTRFFGYGGIVSTTVMSAGSTSATTMYSGSARANVPFAWIGATRDTQVAAGTWAAVPSSVSLTQFIPTQARGECRLKLSGGNLLLSPFNGSVLSFAAGDALVPAAGVTLAPPAVASTTYYIYAVQTNGLVTSLENSATGYVTDPITGITTKSGDATRVLVGMARTTGANAWADSNTTRYVRSFFNDPGIAGYNVSGSDVTTGSTSYVTLSSSGWRVEFLCWLNEVVEVAFVGTGKKDAGSNESDTSLGFDGAGAEDVFNKAQSSSAGVYWPVCVWMAKVGLTEGYHFVDALGRVTVSGNATWNGNGTVGNRCAIYLRTRK